ncbi:hypothetical protein [Paenibacillus sp. sgz500958]|uniref:hypothetical protein n=1 Tax=Paenibacillus sp. sgz500958 TaxID=3242475 RepID=UPI0036D26ACA
MLKKLLKLATITALTAAIFPTGAFADTNKDLFSFTGETYLNMPATEYGGPTTKSQLHVSDFKLNNHKISITGSVTYNGKELPLTLEGRLTNTRIKKDNRSVVIIDTVSGEFDVLHVAIDANVEEGITFTKGLEGRSIISIYLQHKNTREISFFDIDASELGENNKNVLLDEVKHFEAQTKLKSDILKPEKRQFFSANDKTGAEKEQLDANAVNSSDYWFRNVFAPISSDMKSLATTSSLSYYQVVGYKDTDYYYVNEYTGNQPGMYIDEVLQWDYYINHPAPTEFYGTLKIVSEYTDSNYDAYDDPTWAPLTLGKSDNPIFLTFSFNGSGTSSNPWGDTVGVVQLTASATSDVLGSPKGLIKQLVRKKPNWVNVLWELPDLLLNSSGGTLNGNEITISPSSGDSNKAFGAYLEDRRMGTPNQYFTIKQKLEYRTSSQTRTMGFQAKFPVYTRNGFGVYNSLIGSRDLKKSISYQF